jgi:methyl-accepting chemotaxis protein
MIGRFSLKPSAFAALDAVETMVMLTDRDLVIRYVNPPLLQRLKSCEETLKRDLPRFSADTVVGSSIDVFHRRPEHQRVLLRALKQRHNATIRFGDIAFDLKVSPLSGGGVVVEWADAGARLLNLDYAAQMAAIERNLAKIEFLPSGEVLAANDNFLRALGYRLDQIVGRPHSLFLFPEDAAAAPYASFWRALSAGQFQAGEFRRRDAQGQEVWIQGSYNPILDEQGQVCRIVKFATVISGRIQAVRALSRGLERLSDNDLSTRISQTIDPEFALLRDNFNAACQTLDALVADVAGLAHSVGAAAQEISLASSDLSRRTEHQAATLEETAAALDEITATVNRSAEVAHRTAASVSTTRDEAVRSGEVVQQATLAMGRISEASRQIGGIVSIIDEIAFQTNLLALNAGVEAARAGEAGRGFAVVAHEVRALAQRSAEAAKQIKTLIATSGGEVETGVKLVADAGRALATIVEQVGAIDGLTQEIALSAREQAACLDGVNAAINQMDQVTQQNAAMVEQATAASAGLSGEAASLQSMIGRFRYTAHAVTTLDQGAPNPVLHWRPRKIA